MRIVLLLLLALVIAGAAYIRLAPSDPAVWHREMPATPPGDHDLADGFKALRVLSRPGPEVLAELDAAIMATPRTQRLAGSVAEGTITYVTRSKWLGFPDYTTVWLTTEPVPMLSLHGRLRFGGGDFGTNAKRIRGWLDKIAL